MALLPLLLAGSIAVTPLSSAETAPAEQAVHPALWVIKDADTTIYLFGTFHALDGTTNWFKGDVKTAFDRSNELILETLVPELPKKNGATAPAPQSTSGQAKARFAKRGAESVSLSQTPPPASLLASTQIVMNASNARGMSSSQGADAILRDAAENRGETVAGLESFQFQLNMFSSLPAPESPAPTPDPETMRKISIALAQLQDAWNRGDITAFDPMLAQMRAQSPVSYETMFVQRNAHWAHWIAERLQQPGVVFVAVGAGHLTGPDSVQNQLAAAGVKSERIE
jgi:uncharacterized protein YbaP (TraB family)